MTREQLIKAIYENDDAWSCSGNSQGECIAKEKDSNAGLMDCYECAKRQIAEYEQKIKEEAIADIVREIHTSLIAEITMLKMSTKTNEDFDVFVFRIEQTAEYLMEKIKETNENEQD